MKISVITLHRVPNYGSVLQAYALQEKLKEMGHEAVLVNYQPGRMSFTGMLRNIKYKTKKLEKSLMLRTAARLILIPSYIKRFWVFHRFVHTYLNQTAEEYHNLEELMAKKPAADRYLTGSDQVWNSSWNGGIDRCLFMEYAAADWCASYAASFGKEELDEWEKEKTKELLRKYQQISVREASGVTILDALGIKAVQVPDPTLLLGAKRYQELASNRFAGKSYIFVYNINRESGLNTYATRLAKEKGLPIYYATYQYHDAFRKGKMFCNPPVQDFLGLLKNAAYVVTDSFHCTVFSVLFKRQLCVYYPHKYATRLASVVDTFGLSERVITEESLSSVADAVIDFAEVEERLLRERRHGEAFLNGILQTPGIKSERFF